MRRSKEQETEEGDQGVARHEGVIGESRGDRLRVGVDVSGVVGAFVGAR